MAETLYILTRTSGRPEYFRRCRESVKALTWPGKVVHIVHTDDPRDTYVEGDIIIKGECFSPAVGRGAFNKYMNRLLEAIPGEGWVHMIDDDDEYLGPDVLNWLHGQDRKVMHVFKTRRKGMKKQKTVIFPAHWKNQKSFQTECFALWSTIATKYKWWSHKGGDHQYTKKITRHTPIKWHDTLASQAQERKGGGRRLDMGLKKCTYDDCDPNMQVWFKMFRNGAGKKQQELIKVPLSEAMLYEKRDFGRVTFKGVNVCK